jgi:CRP-like cAMP-binding protein
MPIELAGFAQALARCADFDGVPADALELALEEAGGQLQVQFVNRSDEPLISSGDPFDGVMFIQSGTVAPWQYPMSELRNPFLLGEHELLMGASRWVATYSAVEDSVVINIPVPTMEIVLSRLPAIRANMHRLVLRRLSRFYWTSLAITGSAASRVAAALVSRLALEDLDFGEDRRWEISQGELARLTTMSRSAVADGLAEISRKGIISVPGSGTRFSGVILIPSVAELKSAAYEDVRTREIQSLITQGE